MVTAGKSPAVRFVIRHTFLTLELDSSDDDFAAVCGVRPRACSDSRLSHLGGGFACDVGGIDSDVSTDVEEDPVSGASLGRIDSWADASESDDESQSCEDKQVSSIAFVPPPGRWDVSTLMCAKPANAPLRVAHAPVDLECPDARTTLRVEGLPKNLTRAAFLDILALEGLLADCDFVYVPLDFARECAYGYALVNISNPDVLSALWARADCPYKSLAAGSITLKSGTACQISWNGSCQGLPALKEKFRNSQLMHRRVDDASRPILLQQGVRVPFPSPTKVLRAPRTVVRKNGQDRPQD